MLIKRTTIINKQEVLWADILNTLDSVGMIDIDTEVYKLSDDSDYMVYYEKLNHGLVKDTSNGWIVISLNTIGNTETIVSLIYPDKQEVEDIKTKSEKLCYSSLKMLVNELTRYINKEMLRVA